MVVIRFDRRELNIKLYYAGPEGAGKRSCLEFLQTTALAEHAGDMVEHPTEGDTTLFFTYAPNPCPSVGKLPVRAQLYTVPGKVYYNATRKLAVQGAAGVAFVADSRPERLAENLEALAKLEENLRVHEIDPDGLPMVFLWNKRDLPDALDPAELEAALNKRGRPAFEIHARAGEGLLESFSVLLESTVEHLCEAYGFERNPPRPAPPWWKPAARQREGQTPPEQS